MQRGLNMNLNKDIVRLIEKRLSKYHNSKVNDEYRNSTELYGNYVIFRPSFIYNNAGLDMHGFYFNYRKLGEGHHYCNDIWNFRKSGSHGKLPKKYF